MKSENIHKINNQTAQQMPDGSSVVLNFTYPANFKIGDTIEVTTPYKTLQLFVPQHEEGCFVFEIEVWDDRVRLHCDSMKPMKIFNRMGEVFSFRIREIELFAHAFPAVKKVEVYN